jgi:branched-chain amino acid transport system substrate-binding protein
MRPVNGDLSYPDGFQAAQVAADAINAAGGIKGHKVVIDTCDDQDDPNVATSCANTLINKDHVVVMVGTFSRQADSLYADLQKAGVPDFCNNAIASLQFSSSLSFPCIGGISAILNVKLATEGKDYGSAEYVTYGDATGQVTYSFAKQGFQAAGISNVSSLTITDSQVDVSPIAAKLEANTPAVFSSGITDPLNVKLMESLASAGKKIPLIITSGSNGDTMTDGAAQAGYPITTVAAFGYGTATFKSYLAQVAKYGNGQVHNVYEDPTFIAWLGVTLFAQVADTLPNVTSSAFIAALNAGPLQTGVTPPISWSKPGPLKDFPRLTNVYGTVATLKGTTWVQSGPFGTGIPGVPAPTSQPS